MRCKAWGHEFKKNTRATMLSYIHVVLWQRGVAAWRPTNARM